MRTKKTVCFFSMLLLFSMLMCSVDASPDTTISFRGGGVTVELAYPEETHPAEGIWHNITLTSTVVTTLRNFTVVIKAPVNSGWVEIFNSQDTFSKLFSQSSPLTYNLSLSLPQEANGVLQCFLFVNTSSIDYLSSVFYTSEVREMTYSELLGDYNTLNNTYHQLVADYDTLNNTYYDLLLNYETLNSSFNDLFADFNALNITYNQLAVDYDALNITYYDWLSNYDTLNASYSILSGNYSVLNNSYNDLEKQISALENKNSQLELNYNNVNASRNVLMGHYSELQSDYYTLNSTFYNMTETKNSLQSVYDALNKTYNDLLQDLNNLEERVSTSESSLNVDRIVMFIFIVAVAILIAFIVYIKRKQEDPYLVIRKETVSMKSDEET